MTQLPTAKNSALAPATVQAGTRCGPDQALRPLFIVMNAGSGRDTGAAVNEAVGALLHKARHPYEMLVCSGRARLAELVERAVDEAAANDGIVVAAGGDGTIRTVAQRVIAAGLPFGVLARGTFNYFARDNGLPQDPVAGAQALLAGVRFGTERLVQVAQLNDQVFLVNASIGLYPQLLEDREVYKQRYGRSRWVAKWSGLLSLLRRDTEMLLRLEYADQERAPDADVMRASTLFVGNNALQLEQIGLDEEESAAGAQLTVVVLPPMSVGKRLAIAMHGLLGQLREAPDVSSFTCRNMTVEPLARAHRRYMKVAMDGESAWMRPPFVFRLAPRPLRLIVPPPGWSAA